MGHAKLTSFDHSVEWPDFLKKVAGKPKKMSEEVPIVINMTEKNAEDMLKKTLASIEVSQVVDTYDEQFAELQLSLNAHLYRANDSVQRNSIKEKLIEHYGTKKSWQLGAWVYFPWSRELVHILDEDNFTALRTIRNRDLISADEQTELYKYSVA
jgi:hypothetical protein